VDRIEQDVDSLRKVADQVSVHTQRLANIEDNLKVLPSTNEKKIEYLYDDFKAQMDEQVKSIQRIDQALNSIEGRFSKIEKYIWMALGAIAILSEVANLVSWHWTGSGLSIGVGGKP
jgi:chromosome segregation ATPase